MERRTRGRSEGECERAKVGKRRGRDRLEAAVVILSLALFSESKIATYNFPTLKENCNFLAEITVIDIKRYSGCNNDISVSHQCWLDKTRLRVTTQEHPSAFLFPCAPADPVCSQVQILLFASALLRVEHVVSKRNNLHRKT